MKKLLSFAFFAFCMFFVAAVSAQEVAAPTYQKGERWWIHQFQKRLVSSSKSVLQETDWLAEFDGTDFRFYWLEANDAPGEEVTNLQRGILLQVFGRGQFLGGKHIVYPFTVGSTWSTDRYPYCIPGCKREEERGAEIKVEGIEKKRTAEEMKKPIETIADEGRNFPGTYRIFRNDYGYSKGTRWQIYYWYDPDPKGCRCNVRHIFDASSRGIEGARRELEVRRYEPAPGSVSLPEEQRVSKK